MRLWASIVFAAALWLVAAPAAPAQSTIGPPIPGVGDAAPRAAGGAPALPGPTDPFAPGADLNPISVMSNAARLAPGAAGGGGGASEPAGLSAVVNVMILLTVLSLAPSIMLMTTCFVRIIVVLSLLRQAIGTQSLPPPQVITGLALFMTFLVMAPTVERIHDEAVVPYQQGQITDYGELWDRGKQPLRDFMFDQIEATGNWSSLYMVLEYRGHDVSRPERLTRADVDMVSLIPAFMLSELKTAFLMGFRVYLPFLVIDMVISSLLISMSMMMLPPVLISLPFKILLFVLVDGWTLVVGSLMTSFVTRRPEQVAMLGDAWPVALALAGAPPGTFC